jgi:plasmid stabilization system protein ParE
VIQFDDGVLADLERIFGFHLEQDLGWALGQIEKIRSAIMILAEHPRIGRPVEGTELRELVISVGKAGYVALYQYDGLDEKVRVLAMRHQREAGYRGR